MFSCVIGGGIACRPPLPPSPHHQEYQIVLVSSPPFPPTQISLTCHTWRKDFRKVFFRLLREIQLHREGRHREGSDPEDYLVETTEVEG
jgi:hypothetical protein